MTTFQAIVLGLIQGLTEFLPISSTAHLRIIPALLGWEDISDAAFTAVIQLGTLLAVLWYFRADIARLTVGFFSALGRGRPLDNPDARLAWTIVAGSVPIVVLGLLLQSKIKKEFRSLYGIAAAMIVLALLLVVAEWLSARRATHRREAQITWLDGILIGLWQALALVPGASRSGTTITGGLFAGLDRGTAARFSFLLSLPAVFGAGIYELIKDRDKLLASGADALNLCIATGVSAIVGYFSIAWLLRYLQTRSTAVFIVYRIALGIALLVLLATGYLVD